MTQHSLIARLREYEKALVIARLHARTESSVGVFSSALTDLRALIKEAEEQQGTATISDAYDCNILHWHCEHPPEDGTILYTALGEKP